MNNWKNSAPRSTPGKSTTWNLPRTCWTMRWDRWNRSPWRQRNRDLSCAAQATRHSKVDAVESANLRAAIGFAGSTWSSQASIAAPCMPRDQVDSSIAASRLPISTAFVPDGSTARRYAERRAQGLGLQAVVLAAGDQIKSGSDSEREERHVITVGHHGVTSLDQAGEGRNIVPRIRDVPGRTAATAERQFRQQRRLGTPAAG